jgi:hypothetical protein
VENLTQVAHQRLDRVQMADRQHTPGRAHIDRLRREPLLQVTAPQLLQPTGDGCLELTPHLIRPLADGRTFVCRDRSELAQETGQSPGSAEQLVSKPIDGIGVGSGCHGLPGLRADVLEIVRDGHDRKVRLPSAPRRAARVPWAR